MNLFSALISVSSWTFVSRIFGLARDVVIAAVFGAGPLVDAFITAYRLPNTLRRFTAEGALTQAFVPAYKKTLNEDPQIAAGFAGELIFIVTVFLSLLSAIVLLIPDVVLRLIAPGLKEVALAADLLQTVFPYIILISIVAIFSGMLNANHRYQAAAAAPILLNIAIIIAAWVVSPLLAQPITALSWGVLCGGILQLLLVAWNTRRGGLWPHIRPRLPNKRMLTALGKMGQSAIGAGAIQINLLINLAVASLLSSGSISWLYYADRLMELPAGLLGASLATIALPAMSGNPNNANEILDNVLRIALLLAAPAAVGMMILATPIIHTLFRHGAFSAHDVAMTAQAVVAYSVGIIGLVSLRPLAAAFFARADAATPVKIAFMSLAITQLCNAIFVFGLHYQHAGIALSIGIAATFNAGALWWILKRRNWYIPLPGWRRFCIKISVALAGMAASLWICNIFVDVWQQTAIVRVIALAGIILLAAGVYFTILRILGIRGSDFQKKI